MARLFIEQQVADAKNTPGTDKRIKILIYSANILWEFDAEGKIVKNFDLKSNH
ncbi:MAG: hypothetical protein M3405_15365 [Acidobacteriota bacterium]|nr:hypothetical protein [Acidobacteriota bacterium]